MADNILGKGQGTTNPTPNSKVDVPVDVPVKVKFRFFPANITAALEGHSPQEAKSLSGLPFVVGTVQDKTFTPLQKSLLWLTAGDRTVGKLDSDTFRPLTPEETAAWHKALKDAKKKDVPPPEYLHHDTFEYSVKAGTTVAICIAVDAKVKRRQHPLWQVTAKTNDIVVDVFETFGKNGLQEAVGKPITRTEEKGGKKRDIDYYPARLTGDAWMRSTPKLTATDVDAIPADRATAAMKQALKRIYAGDFDAVGQDFAITVPRKSDDKDTASVRLLWRAGENRNCIDNITTLNLKQDVPSRIHPEAYAAAAKAAHDAGIDDVQFSSSWRPMLGSMPHRLSMGLDLVYLKSGTESARLNRAGLLPDKKGHHDSNGNLSTEELKAYDEWQAKSVEAKVARTAAQNAGDALDRAIAAKSRIKTPAPETAEKLNKAIEEAEKTKKEADGAAKAAAKAVADAKSEWGKSVGAHEPGPVGRYRRYVMNAKFVSQVLDPWYLVGLSKHKPDELVPNEQQGENGMAYMHRNHMHLSIRDSELKP